MKRSLIARSLALGVLLGPATLSPAAAAEKIVVVRTADNPVISELAAGFKSAFPGSTMDEVMYSDTVSDADLTKKLNGAMAILSVGPRAATAVAKLKLSFPTVACVPGYQADPKTHGTTLRLQPPADGVMAAVAWMGSYPRVGFITDASNQERAVLAQAAAASRGITAVTAPVASARDVAGAVQELLTKVDLLVVDVADGLSLQDVQFLLRAADTARIPVMGTSEGFIKAGAPIAVAIDPRNVGAEAGRLASAKAAGLSDPRRFRVLVNLVVTQRLGLTVPQDKGTVDGNILSIDADAGELASASRPVATTQPAVTKKGRLTFPPLAMSRQAEVVLEITVKADGSLGKTRVVKGDPLFATAAIDSLNSWQFRAGTSDGKPVDGTLRLNLKFQK